MPATLSPTTRICLDGEPAGTWAEFCVANADGLNHSDLDAIAAALCAGRAYHFGGGAAAEWVIALAGPYDAPITRAGAGKAHKARGSYPRMTDASIAAFLAAERR